MRRLVEICIVDPDEDLPAEQSVVYQGERKMTDLIDSELFFELDISEMVKRHNEVRSGVLVDDKFTGNKVPLKPVKVRDLRMTVITIASF
jgi:hypothetical protein